MWPYYPELLAAPVPRYTSYPTAADFGSIPKTALKHAVENAHGDVSLYIHIPFCEKICFYCGCNTAAAGRRQRVGSYLAALHTEIATLGGMLPSDARVRRISFGGGSPNAIYPSEFLDLVDALHEEFPIEDAEFSIELDPRTMTSDWARAIGAAGSDLCAALSKGDRARAKRHDDLAQHGMAAQCGCDFAQFRFDVRTAAADNVRPGR